MTARQLYKGRAARRDSGVPGVTIRALVRKEIGQRGWRRCAGVVVTELDNSRFDRLWISGLVLALPPVKGRDGRDASQ
jgi:hypothetical protein